MKFLLSALILLGTTLSPGAHALNLKVIGGSKVSPNNYSVALLYSPDGYICSGSVISKRAILTAAHCAFIAASPGAVAFVKGKTYGISSGRKAPGGIDIGIVRTNKNISASPLTVRQGLTPKAGQKFLLLGFGDPNPGVLYAGYMRINRYISSNNEFYATAVDGQNACAGDSGGPALVSYQGKSVVIGVVSRGPEGCNRGNPVIFPLTTTTVISRWIRQNS